MPNHIHGIIIIKNMDKELKIEKNHGFEISERRGRRSLQGVIKDFKSVSTRFYNKMVEESLKNKLWQKSYYERIIRGERELREIREYIDNNPRKWQMDEYFTET
ncbi:MAG: transposase [Clostridia bacterium]|nr:transposase [Clostridia bacterium]MDD4666021.1 transposase [Clostridia bacterium]